MPNVHVLATCKNDSLWPYTVLFLKTIRVGFPTARIIVTANGLSPSQNERLKAGADKINAQVRIDRLEHPEWIQTLLENEQDPFWICDTDVIFYKPVEDWRFSTGISGYLIPEFKDEYTQLVTRSRLHTSLMYIDPYEVKRELDAFKETFRETNFNPVGNLIAPAVIPHHIPYFYDTTS